jgi:oligoribonuclease (3'-5' exoribonuclease)
MDESEDSGNGIFVIVERSETELLLESVMDNSDMYVSKMDDYTITNFDRSTALDRVKETAGASFEQVEVLLPQLKFTREMKTTGWIARKSVYEPANPVPNRIEEMLVSKP